LGQINQSSPIFMKTNAKTASLPHYSTRAAIASAFDITIRFQGGLTSTQQDAFSRAADRWSRIITKDLPAVTVEGEQIDDVLILAKGSSIDGRGGILGQAGPTFLRNGSFLPAKGIMEFDSADLLSMEEDGTLLDVITHEMGHVLGIGTIWGHKGLLQGAGSNDPVYTGVRAAKEYSALLGSTRSFVPVANVGGPGTRDAHWRETTFANELMTGIIASRGNPISRITVGQLEDLGYTVDFQKAEAYTLPTMLELAELGLLVGGQHDHGGHGMMFIPDQTILP
jgi:hypothetical protein